MPKFNWLMPLQGQEAKLVASNHKFDPILHRVFLRLSEEESAKIGKTPGRKGAVNVPTIIKTVALKPDPAITERICNLYDEEEKRSRKTLRSPAATTQDKRSS